MHVLLIHQAFSSLEEAGGTRHFEMARYLAEKGHIMTIIASPISYITGTTDGRKMRWAEKRSPLPGITILNTYTYPGLHRSFVHRVISFFSFMISSFLVGLSVRKVDLLWGTSPPIFQGFTAWLLARLKGVPFLFEVRDLWPAFAIAIGVLKNPFLIWLSLWLERFLYRHAEEVIVNSPGYVDHVTEHGARKVSMIPNGVDPDMFDPKKDGNIFRHNHNLSGQFIALYAGAHGMSNDLGVVLQAAEILKLDQNISIVFIGDGKEKCKLQTLSEEMNLKNVLFLPAVAKKEMTEVLAAADVCIAILKPIELYKTTYPNKVFDYMAAGKPIVLAIDGVIRQVVEDAGGGLFVLPGNPQAMADAIRSLAIHPENARHLGSNGRSYVVQNFDREQLTSKLISVIDRLLENHDSKNIDR